MLITCYPFRTLKPNQPFRYVVTADREPMTGERPNEMVSGCSTGALSISMAGQDWNRPTGPCRQP